MKLITFINIISTRFVYFLLSVFTTAALSNSIRNSSSSSQSCAVVGVGVLGTSLCRQLLRDESSHWTVIGITKTTTHHDIIQTSVGSQYQERFQLFTYSEFLERGELGIPNVIFCAPPSGFDDYPAAVQDACDDIWAGPGANGSFIFTSSGAVYGPGDTSTVTETSPLASVDSSPRVARLVRAEQVCMQSGGCCLRLAGLYTLERGPHHFWLTSGKVIKGKRNGIVNLLHYDDAAAACVAALHAGSGVTNGRAFLISDGHPMSRYEICASALQATMYQKYAMPNFDEESHLKEPPGTMALGKVYDGSASNAALGWKPQFVSFDALMKANV